MAKEFKLPSLGENIESGEVVSVLVKAGQEIAKQEPVLELETDKAMIEVPSSVAGVIEKIHVKEGDKAEVGQVILTFGKSGKRASQEKPKEEEESQELSTEDSQEEHSADKKDGKKSKEKVADKQDSRRRQESSEEASEQEPEQEEDVPSEEDAADDEGDAPGDTEDRDDDESSSEHRKKAATGSSTQRRSKASEGGAEVVAFAARPGGSRKEKETIAAAPSVRRLAREIGVDITRVKGSGPRGRISEADVKAESRLRGSQRTPASENLPDFERWGDVETEDFSNVRRKTAEHMAHCWRTIPHVTQHDHCDVTELEERRRHHGKKVEAAGGKLTVTAIVLKVVAAALKVFPQFNASIDVAGERIVYKKYIHIGVAVDTPRGLMVPVIRDVNEKNILQLSSDLLEVAAKARDRKLSLEDLQGGTFTITNLGGIGGTSFTPIVNWPEVAILGISRSGVMPVYQEGQFVPRTILPLSLSYDHRLIDGADAARFLRWVVEALQDPFLISLEG